MNKRVKNNVLAGLIVLAFMGMATVGCNKYDKMSILGEWTIDLKKAKGLNVEIAKETLCFNSGSDQTYRETHEERATAIGNWENWEIKGNFERKNNKITFSNRVKGSGEQMKPETYKYKIDGNKLILICEDEGYTNDEKIYTKK